MNRYKQNFVVKYGSLSQIGKMLDDHLDPDGAKIHPHTLNFLAHRPDLQSEHLAKILSIPQLYAPHESAVTHKNATAEHLKMGLNHESHLVRVRVFRDYGGGSRNHPGITPEMTRQGMHDPHHYVRMAAMTHPITGEHDRDYVFKHMVNDPEENIRLVAEQYKSGSRKWSYLK